MKPTISDAIISNIQKQFYERFGGTAHAFAPMAESEIKELDCGVVLHNEIQFSERYPNSFADIYYTNSDFSIKRPTIIYLHGGGWFMGSRTSGDPLASVGGIIGKQNVYLARLGYNVVSMDYCLSPRYRFPDQIIQIDEGLGFFKENSDKFHLDMSNVIIMGGSAGAVMTAILGCVYSNPAYASQIGVVPSMSAAEISGLVIDGAPMNVHVVKDEGILHMIKSWLGDDDMGSEKANQIHVCRWVTENYPKTFLTAGNDRCFPEHTQELGDALRAKGVEVSDYYIDPAVSKQGHGYMGAWETDPYAKEGMNRQMSFIKRVTTK